MCVVSPWLVSVSGLKCFIESGGKSLKIESCPYFPGGNPKVCYSRTQGGQQQQQRRGGRDGGGDEDDEKKKERGCDFLKKLGGKFMTARKETTYIHATYEYVPKRHSTIKPYFANRDYE